MDKITRRETLAATVARLQVVPTALAAALEQFGPDQLVDADWSITPFGNFFLGADLA